jgi:hypothetical protein
MFELLVHARVILKIEIMKMNTFMYTHTYRNSREIR